MEQVQNIFCVGRNYRLHAAELGNQVPTSPFLFMKPTHAQVIADGQDIQLPSDQGAIHYEVELVVHINQAYKKGMKADELIDRVSLGIDFTMRDLQDQLKEKKLPWLLAKGFRNSAILTASTPISSIAELEKVDFGLLKNGQEVQRGNITDMIFDIQALVDFTGEYFGLGKGDVLFTGTPAGVGAIADGDHLELVFGDKVLGSCVIKLS
ncbi:fumarylacetoacetate hydrolase family protein [Brevibacillus laterosporus]|uniref:fumarylacetoacetate hydrolase family protein n=1 Tax=Brevibacillus laterosporus TaxID=1465 RepID=UPI002E230EE0|nr:fumarylacetoacetate hydrolase family protein [Brevibacillus laterosporus]